MTEKATELKEQLSKLDSMMVELRLIQRTLRKELAVELSPFAVGDILHIKTINKYYRHLKNKIVLVREVDVYPKTFSLVWYVSKRLRDREFSKSTWKLEASFATISGITKIGDLPIEDGNDEGNQREVDQERHVGSVPASPSRVESPSRRQPRPS